MSEQHDGNVEQQRRRFYLLAFVVALGVDLIVAFARSEPYRPTLIGLAIMITSALFFVYSWLKERYQR